jgi:glycosyltransferase involved in cell wall biosynthesis
MGGAEDVLESLVAAFPGAPVFTSMYWRERMPHSYETWDIRTTWLDRAPGIHEHHRTYLPFYALAFATLDLSDFDVVLSNKSGFCHGVHAGTATHVCYCLAPTRYVWEFDAYVAKEAFPPAMRAALRPLIGLLRSWDHGAAQRVTKFIAISRAVRDRIKTAYGRDSVVIHPPVNTSAFAAAGPSTMSSHPWGDDYYLIVSRLVAYRRLDEAVKAFSRLGRRLIIAGEGPDRDRLEAMAGPSVAFLGRVPADDLVDLFRGCRAYVLPGEEDFGIAPVQAQAAGRSVIAFAGGGALDTVVEGITGSFYAAHGADALADAVIRHDPQDFDPRACRESAARFGAEVFIERITEFVAGAFADGT